MKLLLLIARVVALPAMGAPGADQTENKGPERAVIGKSELSWAPLAEGARIVRVSLGN